MVFGRIPARQGTRQSSRRRQGAAIKEEKESATGNRNAIHKLVHNGTLKTKTTQKEIQRLRTFPEFAEKIVQDHVIGRLATKSIKELWTCQRFHRRFAKFADEL